MEVATTLGLDKNWRRNHLISSETTWQLIYQVDGIATHIAERVCRTRIEVKEEERPKRRWWRMRVKWIMVRVLGQLKKRQIRILKTNIIHYIIALDGDRSFWESMDSSFPLIEYIVVVGFCVADSVFCKHIFFGCDS